MSHILSMKEGFLAEWLALPPKEQAQVGSKLRLLTADPLPDAKTKKKLRHLGRDLYRLRSGDYRVFYTFDDRFVSALKLSRRSEDTYDSEVEEEFLGGPDEPSTRSAPGSATQYPQRPPSIETATVRLPTPITEDLLARLLVPAQFWSRLVSVSDEDALLACAGVPDDLLLRLHRAVFEPALSEVFAQRELVATNVDELFRYRDGDLLAFLLRLSAEQEKFVSWALDGAGPTLVKGGPGTGKSTVALYRVRAMLQSLRAAGVEAPRILFTTYTNALVAFSEQLLRSLLGEEARFVEVRTADAIALSVVTDRLGPVRIADQREIRDAMSSAMNTRNATGSSLAKRASASALELIGRDYLIEEIGTVIEGRRLATLQDYRDAKRVGRRVRLADSTRMLVWELREEFNRELKRIGKTTFQQIRAQAAQLVESGDGPTKYDAVLIDEAQDLDPSLLWLLASLAKQSNRVFLTADANQSIYGAGFRWADVHEGLNFKGRTGVLRSNFRSTREIGEAARAYLAAGALEDDIVLPTYTHVGPLPVVRRVANNAEETPLLIRFLRDAAREMKLPVWAGAVLVPGEKIGEKLAKQLSDGGLPARFMTGRELDLATQAVKVITLKSAKGLEFPTVILAGFDQTYPHMKVGISDEERTERLAQERRTLFVGMTRAMRALLVSIPDRHTSPLFEPLDVEHWNTDRGTDQ